MVPNASLLGRAEVAFDAEVVSVADGEVTLEPTRWYAGTPVDLVTVRQSSTSMRDLVGAVRFREGRRYLVAANHGAVMVCGFSGEHAAELEALYTEAFVDQAE